MLSSLKPRAGRPPSADGAQSLQYSLLPQSCELKHGNQNLSKESFEPKLFLRGADEFPTCGLGGSDCCWRLGSNFPAARFIAPWSFPSTSRRPIRRTSTRCLASASMRRSILARRFRSTYPETAISARPTWGLIPPMPPSCPIIRGFLWPARASLCHGGNGRGHGVLPGRR